MVYLLILYATRVQKERVMDSPSNNGVRMIMGRDAGRRELLPPSFVCTIKGRKNEAVLLPYLQGCNHQRWLLLCANNN